MNRFRASLALWVLATLSSPVASQDLPSLTREQAQLEERLAAARGLMERLLEGFRAEGRETNIQLLERGLGFLEASQLQTTVSNARRGLQDGRLHEASQHQIQAAEKLEALLSLLLNRMDPSDLEENVRRLQETLEALQGLTREQARIREETAETFDRSRDRTERALLDGLDDLARRQRDLAATTGSLQPAGTASLEAVLNRLRRLTDSLDMIDQNLQPEAPGHGLLEKLEALRSRQTEQERMLREAQSDQELAARLSSLAERAGSLSSTGPQREAEAAQLTQEAARLVTTPDAPSGLAEAQEALRRMAGNPGAAEAAKEFLEAASREAARRASERAQEARSAMETHASALEEAASQIQSLDPNVASALQRAAAELARGATEAKPGSAQRDALETSFQALMRATNALEQTGADPARALRGARAEAEMAARELKQVQGPRETTALLEEAASRLDLAADGAQQGARAQALEKTGEANTLVRQAIQDLGRLLSERTSGLEEALGETGARQAELAQEAFKLQERLADAERAGQISRLQQEGAQAGMQAARQAMDQARRDLAEGRLDGARRAQEQAARDLERSRQALEQGHRPGSRAAEELAQLAREEEALRQEILDLARRLDPSRDAQALDALGEAARLAGEASRGMQEGDPGEAQGKAEATEEKLKQAERELAEKRNRYLNLRQEELLFRITEELTDLLTRHRAIQQETRELDQQVLQAGGRLSRSMRARIGGLGGAERDLAGKCRYLLEHIEAEGSLVFSAALRGIEADLEEVARMLTGREPDTGSRVQGLQEDVTRAAERLLLATRRELRRKKEDQARPQPPDGTNQAPPRPKLVPDLAELRLLKALQEDLLERTRSFARDAAIPGAESVLAPLLERHAHRQSELSALFQQFAERIGPRSEESPREDAQKEGR